MKKRVTIKSIAQDLGMSHMTVSRALSNSPKVKEETRKAVQTKAAEMGYIPNQAALAMRGDSSGVIGLLIPNIENEFYAAFSNRMSIECAKHNFQLMIGLTQDDPQAEVTAITRLLKHQAMSIIIVPTPQGMQEIPRLLENTHTVQFIRVRNDIQNSLHVIYEEDKAFGQAVKALSEAGCKRIAFIGGSQDLSTGRARLESTMKALLQSKQAIDPGLIKTGAPSPALGESALLELMALESPPDGVITAGFEISNGALKTCLEHRINIPAQLKFVGFGDPSWYQWVCGGISTISPPIEVMVKQTMDLLLENQTSGASRVAEERAITAQFINRRSV